MSEKNNLRPWQEPLDTDFTDEAVPPVDSTVIDEPSPESEAPSPKLNPARKKSRKARSPKKASRAAPSPSQEISGKNAKAEVASMYLHWKRIHEISGKIMANLEEFSEQIKTR
jgi:hypothetical protein